MNDALALPPLSDAPTIRQETESTQQKISALSKIEITIVEQRAAFASALAEIQASRKRIVAREKELTRRPLAELDQIRAVSRPCREAWEALEELIKGKLRDFEVRTSLAVSAAVERAQERSAAGDAAGAAEAIASITAPLPSAPGMQVRHPWRLEVRSVELLEKKYLLPNYPALVEEQRRQLAERPDQAPVIPGVRFYRDLVVAGRKKSE